MKINFNFPKYEINDLIEVDPKEQNGAFLVKVLRKWYPNKNDKFTERDEIKNLGYLNGKPNEPFPQLVCKVIKTNNKTQLNTKLHLRSNLICLQGNEFNKLYKL